MRRACSILVISAMLCSVLSLQATTSCHRNGALKMCHRTPEGPHHCEMTQEGESSNEDSSSSLIAVELAPKCPMNCCFQLGSGNSAVIPARTYHAKELSIQSTFEAAQDVFVRNGFSSHTDRGPPAA